jgi:hypothetical protein
VVSLAFVLAAFAACGDDDDNSSNEPPKVCSTVEQTGCLGGQVCEEVQGGTVGCYAPIAFEGRVFDALDAAEKGIEGARVVARDANDAAVSTVAITAADGTYSLKVPARRDVNGVPVSLSYTLRADALGYQTFPLPPRVALPIDVSTATGDPLVVKSVATDVGLIKLKSTTGLGSIAGAVLADNPGGTLVVAGGVTGIADFGGDYVIFNVPAGSNIDVRGYSAGLQLAPTTATVTANAETAGVDLVQSGLATADVTGQVQIVNGNGASVTSVILAVEDTFIETAARGEAPKGLRALGVSGAFTIADVPDGKYVVLAAFENDRLIRDPDTGIGGTDILHITVAGQNVDIAEGFKVTGAIDVVSPGAGDLEEVSAPLEFSWVADSSEDHYEVHLFNAYGDQVWENLAVPEGNGTITTPYDGDPLIPGMVYQFRALSIGMDTIPISATEDLRGAFTFR